MFSASESTGALRFGRYEVLFRIAAGGMAEVYAARMVGEGGFEKPVALKRMLPTLAEDERFVEMFLDEGKLAAHISSPHVVQTLDLGRAEDDSLYLVMELVVGVSLSALIRAVLRGKAQFSPAIAVEILSQAAAGLHDAHEARTMYGQPLEIVHRDISPQNILVDVAGRVRITDFGVARALERATHTQSGEVKGKIGYFAPEQVRGKNVDRRTDIFAMGICAWETIAGRRLFQGDNPAQTLDMVMSMPVPRLDELRPDVPVEVAGAIARALERDQEARFQTAGEFAETLRYAMRPSGAKGVAELVRSHGGESLMKLEEGLRVRSPSTASRVRRAESSRESALESSQPSRPGRASMPEPTQAPTVSAAPSQPLVAEPALPPDPPSFSLQPTPLLLEELPTGPSSARWLLAGLGTVTALAALGGLGWAISLGSAGPSVTSSPLATPAATAAQQTHEVVPNPPTETAPTVPPSLPLDVEQQVVDRTGPPSGRRHGVPTTGHGEDPTATMPTTTAVTHPPEPPTAPNIEARDTPARDTPARDIPARDTPARDTPARDTPARDTTVTAPVDRAHVATMMSGLAGLDEFEEELQ